MRTASPAGCVGAAPQRAKTAAGESEKRYRSLFDASLDAILLTMTDGRILAANESACRILGYTEAELKRIGRNGVVDASDERLPLALEERKRTGKFHGELTLLRKGGAKFPVELSAAVFEAGDGTTQTSLIVRDITERKRAAAALLESEERFRELISKVPGVAVQGYAVDGTTTYWNQASERLYGYAAQEAIGRNLLELIIPPDMADGARRAIRQMAETGQPLPASELSLRRKDGSRVAVFSSHSIVNIPGRPTELFCLDIDLTARKQAEAALRESEERYQRITEAVTDYIYTVRVADGRAQETNHGPGCLAVTGYAADEFARDPFLWLRMVAEADRPKVEEQARRILAGEELRSLEHRIVRKNGMLRWVRNTFVTHRDKHGGLVAYAGLIQDITERKQAEEALSESEASLRESQSIAGLGSYVLDIATGVWRSSDVLDQVFGIDRAYEHSVEGWETVIHPADREMMADYFKNDVVGRRQGFNKEYRIVRRDNQAERWVHGLGRLEFDAEGRPIRMRGTIQDITERKCAEEEKDKLAAQNQQLQKAESLGRMAGAIAHHFNNQLQAVMMRLEVAINDLPQELGSVESLNEAMKSARKAGEVSSLMLTYLGQTDSRREPLDLAEVCLRGLALLRVGLPSRVTLETNFISPGPGICANANQIQQVLTNLVTNGWEASADGPSVIRVTIKTVAGADISSVGRFPLNWQPAEPAYAALEVADNGSGIAADDLANIFDPFFSSKFTGRGLGLPVVLGIARTHDGGVTVESAPGQGSRFRVFFPLLNEAVSVEPRPEIQAPKTAAGGTVLVVEDSPAVRIGVTLALEHFGFKVFAAEDGVEGVERFRQHRDEIGCVLCDLTMPRMDGWQTLTALRQLAPGLPVILASGYTEGHVMAGDHPELPQALLHKPYDLAQLREAINQALAKA